MAEDSISSKKLSEMMESMLINDRLMPDRDTIFMMHRDTQFRLMQMPEFKLEKKEFPPNPYLHLPSIAVVPRYNGISMVTNIWFDEEIKPEPLVNSWSQVPAWFWIYMLIILDVFYILYEASS